MILGASGFAQKHTTIVFRYNQDSIKKDSFHFQLEKILSPNTFGENIVYPCKLIAFNKKKEYSETICDYAIKDTTCAFIFDLIGHETFIIPGDTMTMNVLGSGGLYIFKQFKLPWSFFLTYEGKNKFVYSLFDSLSFVAGEMRYNYLHFNKTDTLNTFCDKAQSIYLQQLTFLDRYCKLHKIAAQFKKIAQDEIHAAYISNLTRPMGGVNGLNINAYSTPYREALLKSGFNDPSVYFKTSIYRSTAYTYAYNVLSSRKLGDDNSDVISLYKTIKQNYTDTIRNHLLMVHLTGYLLNPQIIYPCYDSLITDFKSICKNYLYTHCIDSLFAARKAKGIRIYSLKDAMSSQIKDQKDQILNVKQLFKTKPLLIICWASWCGPCLREIPAEKKMQKIYGDKVDFVYLSFDKSKKLWIDKLQTLSIKGDENYLLTDYFNSDLAGYYKINSIPFYLLYDKNGKKVEIKDLRPSDDGFKNVLDKLIL